MQLDELLTLKKQQWKPRVVCLCGSTRFMQAFQDAACVETVQGRIVLSIGCNTKSDEECIQAGGVINKVLLDTLHLWKIDLADEILVLNVGGYVGESTRREIAYAHSQQKVVRWLETPGDEWSAVLVGSCNDGREPSQAVTPPKERSEL